MADPRTPGKRLIGAQASSELWRGVDQWLELNPRATVTDFVLEACIEKLRREEIPIDEIEARRDRRGRQPHTGERPGSYGPSKFETTALNDAIPTEKLQPKRAVSYGAVRVARAASKARPKYPRGLG